MKDRLFGKIIIIVVVLILSCAVIMSAAALKEKPAEEKGSSLSLDDSDDIPGSGFATISTINVDEIDPFLKQATPYWMLLLTGKDEQKALIRFIKSSDASEEEKKDWKKVMISLWKKYPLKVKKVKDRNHKDRNQISCEPSPHEVVLTEKEQKTLEAVFQEIMKGIEAKAPSTAPDGEISVQWLTPPTHENFIYIATMNEGFNSLPLIRFAEIARDNAGKPDYWNYDANIPLPDPRDSNAKYLIPLPIGFVIHPYNHGYIPPHTVWTVSPSGVLTPVLIPEYCIAPENAMTYASTARANYLAHNYDGAFQNLGYSSHFLSDVGNPYHTTLSTVLAKPLHDAYEDYVANYWSVPVAGGQSHSFEYYAMNAGRITITDPESATKQLAIDSNQDADTLTFLCFWNALTNLMVGNGPHFEQWGRIGQVTTGRVSEIAGYTRGLVHYVTGGQPVVLTITPNAGPHGTITPSTPQNVPYEYTGVTTFTIIADSGYQIQDVLVDGISKGPVPSYTFPNDRMDHTISATFKSTAPPPSSGAEWIWSRDGWGDWQHTASWSGTQVGPNSEYGPVMVNGHGEHGTNTNLLAGSTQASVWRTFSDSIGTGWNTLTFDGMLSASDVPGGRWMTIDVNGQQVFAATELNTPPGNGKPFEIAVRFPQTRTATVKISHGQNPAWGPRFYMEYDSLRLSLETGSQMTALTTPSGIPPENVIAANMTETETPASG
jgi:hypothetical protein